MEWGENENMCLCKYMTVAAATLKNISNNTRASTTRTATTKQQQQHYEKTQKFMMWLMRNCV